MAANSPHASAELVSLSGLPVGSTHGDARSVAVAPPSGKLTLIAAAGGLYLLYLAWLTVVLGFELVQGDAVLYWKESFNLSAPYSTWWVPGYPFLLAFVRAATFGTLPPAAVMLVVSGTFYVVAVGTVRALAEEFRLAHPDRIALLFAGFPFTGLAYSVWPISDITAVALCLLCQLSFTRRRWKSFAVYAACALMVHKVMWFFVPCLMLFAWVKHAKSRPVVPLAVVPLATWVVAGAIHYQDALWFLRWGVEHLVVSRSALPVLDGLIGPFLTGDLNKILKGCLILGIVALAVVILYRSWGRADWGGTSMAAMLVLVAMIMNQYEVWVVARFSKLLIIPLAVTLSQRAIWNRVLENRMLYAALLFASIGSNVAFSHYMAQFFD